MLGIDLTADIRWALDPACFAREALGFQPDDWQERALRWSRKRLLLNCCRQGGKSTTASIIGLHGARFYPGSLVLLVSPSLRQSSELFRKVGEGLARLETRPHLLEDNRLSLTLDNNSRIVSLPSSENTVRGYSGAALIVIDEASRVPDDLYYAVRPMLAVSSGRLILMSTPFGKRGFYFKEWSEGGDVWERIEIRATQCPRIPRAFLAEERASLGDFFFRQEYMCEFMDSITSVFDYETVMQSLSSEIKPLFPVTRGLT